MAGKKKNLQQIASNKNAMDKKFIEDLNTVDESEMSTFIQLLMKYMKTRLSLSKKLVIIIILPYFCKTLKCINIYIQVNN